MKIKWNWNKRTRNILTSSFCMCLSVMAAAPAILIQNIALAESSDIDLSVGYYSEVLRSSTGIITCLLFYPVYKKIGIKVVAMVSTILITAAYWTMIWIVNEGLIYLGAAISGMGWGSVWVLWPMVIMENSKNAKNAQTNMGIWFAGASFGEVIGGLCNYFYFDGVYQISVENRQMVYGICAGITIFASFVAAVGLTQHNNHKQSGNHQPPNNKEIAAGSEVTDEIEGKKNDSDTIEIEIRVPGKQENTEDKRTKLDFDSLTWCKKMLKLPAFYLLGIPLLYWGVLWGYYLKILPTAIASISDSRNLLPLGAVIGGACSFFGATLWDFVSRATNNLFCISLASLMIVSAAILSILTFPKGAATEILEVGSVETYIKPDSIYVVVIQGLIMLADVGISIIFYAAAGQIYGEGTTLGYASNMVGFSFFYICSMFAPDLFNLHSYCYLMIAAVLLMCFTFFTGLRKFI